MSMWTWFVEALRHTLRSQSSSRSRLGIVGLDAGRDFVDGLKTSGLEFVVGGALIPLICLIFAAYFGKYLLKLNNVELSGALAGADTSAVALGALQDTAKSNLVTLGYTITYALGNIVLTVWGTVIVAILATKTAI
jgi:putative transport protein